MTTELDYTIGNKLKIKRKSLGMSQQDLGKKVGVTFQQIQKYEKGTNRISASRLYLIAQTLNVSLNYFFESAVDQQQAA